MCSPHSIHGEVLFLISSSEQDCQTFHKLTENKPLIWKQASESGQRRTISFICLIRPSLGRLLPLSSVYRMNSKDKAFGGASEYVPKIAFHLTSTFCVRKVRKSIIQIISWWKQLRVWPGCGVVDGRLEVHKQELS